MIQQRSDDAALPGSAMRASQPILALDVPGTREAVALAGAVASADFVKVGLQLYTAAGPEVVRELRAMGRRIFLDLKLHDIPNTVAGAVESAGELGVELLTVHASGGRAMLRAASRAADRPGAPALLGVTVLTSLDSGSLGEAWGRVDADLEAEVVRLALLASEEGLHGVVASVAELEPLRAALPAEFRILTPGIRLPGDAAGDQARVATPAEAARRGAHYLVLGRTVTAAADPAAAFARVVEELQGEAVA